MSATIHAERCRGGAPSSTRRTVAALAAPPLLMALAAALSACAAAAPGTGGSPVAGSPVDPAPSRPSLVVHEQDLAVEQPGPHDGGGATTAYPFFDDAEGLELVFRKRVLHPGSSIGLHPHDHDEIYYVLSGRGVYTLDGREHDVGPGHAMLIRPGSAHAMRPSGANDLVLLILYRDAH